jgi:hypothetical protein
MWGSAFYIDDSKNGQTADNYGIVMGTSHEEPMARSIPIEWNVFGNGTWDYNTNAEYIYDFWVNSTERAKPFETLYTMGMRGNGDLALSGGQNIELMEKIIADQNKIFQTVFNESDITDVPKMWCLCALTFGSLAFLDTVLMSCVQTRRCSDTTRAVCVCQTTSRSCGPTTTGVTSSAFPQPARCLAPAERASTTTSTTSVTRATVSSFRCAPYLYHLPTFTCRQVDPEHADLKGLRADVACG